MTTEDTDDATDVVRQTFEQSLNMEMEDLQEVEIEVDKEMDAERIDREPNNDREGKFTSDLMMNTMNSPESN
jgi:hypothetical protein